MVKLPRGTNLTQAESRRVAQWARRNPDQAAAFNKLPASRRGEILSHFKAPTARGVTASVRAADIARRAKVAERSRERRAYAKVAGPVVQARRDAVAAKISAFYGLNPEYAANLRHNLQGADPATLRLLEDAQGDALRRIIAAQVPDGATLVFHYHTRR